MHEAIGAKACIPNSALALFEPLIGEWQTTGVHPHLPGADLHGRVLFESIEGGAFLRMRTQVDHPEIPDGVAIFGSDNSAKTYYMIYFDERGTSRKYDVSIHSDRLTWWRDDPQLAQRFTIDIASDKLVGNGEMSQAGGDWEKDLSLTYAR